METSTFSEVAVRVRELADGVIGQGPTFRCFCRFAAQLS